MRCWMWTAGLFAAAGIVVASETGTAEDDLLVTCLAGAADHSPVFATKVFYPSSREIAAVVRLPQGTSFTEATHVWIAVNVGDVAPPNYEIARNRLAFAGQRAATLRYSQDVPLPVGSYRLEVLGDEKPWRSVSFDVAAAPSAPPLISPKDLLPLATGVEWEYRFEQCTKGRSTAPEGAGTEQKRVTARVRLAVADVSEGSAHIRLERDGALMAEEWWRVGPEGLSAVKRRSGTEMFALDPPQILLALPLANAYTWTYEAKDGSFAQRSRMWGPCPVHALGEEKPGYIVLTEQAIPGGKSTAERLFLPGLGLVREVIVTAAAGDLVTRQEMTLEAHRPAKGAPLTSPPAK